MSQFRFIETMRNFEKLKREEPLILGNMAQRYFRKSFEEQGWDGEKWKEPQRRIPGTAAYKYPKKNAEDRHNRAILVGKQTSKRQTGQHLRQSVNESLKLATFDQILFSVPQVYAKRHNYGEDGMPQRKFLGYSQILMKSLEEKLAHDMQSLHRK